MFNSPFPSSSTSMAWQAATAPQLAADHCRDFTRIIKLQPWRHLQCRRMQQELARHHLHRSFNYSKNLKHNHISRGNFRNNGSPPSLTLSRHQAHTLAAFIRGCKLHRKMPSRNAPPLPFPANKAKLLFRLSRVRHLPPTCQ